MTQIAVINGPNLNALGARETEHYGSKTLDDINHELIKSFKNVSLSFFQSNHEGALIDHIQKLNADGIVINPGALTHTSIALRDALSAKKLPVVEVHLSNIFKREEFRRTSYISGVAVGVISGFWDVSYHLGIEALLRHVQK